MLLYLMLIQYIATLVSNFVSTKTSSAVVTYVVVGVLNTVGGYAMHLSHVPFYLKWIEYISPQRWLLPILAIEEYSQDTLANTAGQLLCRNKQVRSLECYSGWTKKLKA